MKNIYRVMKQTLSDKNNKKITTSSSGGIDSAIILYNIKKILKTKDLSPLQSHLIKNTIMTKPITPNYFLKNLQINTIL